MLRYDASEVYCHFVSENFEPKAVSQMGTNIDAYHSPSRVDIDFE